MAMSLNPYFNGIYFLMKCGDVPLVPDKAVS